MLVLDASVTATWVFPDEVSEYSEHVLDYLGTSGAVAPFIWPLEVANILLLGERRGRLTEAQTARAIVDIERLRVRVAGPSAIKDLDALVALGRLGRTTAYDASYLDLAMKERLPLATLDQRLRAAALQLGITLFS